MADRIVFGHKISGKDPVFICARRFLPDYQVFFDPSVIPEILF
jgi:hypothetical protein